MKNILITSAGKRVSLTRVFMKELKAVHADGKVFTADMNPGMAPACFISDGCFKVPRCTSDDYIQALLDLCEKHEIGLVIPTIDTELAVLAAHKAVFAGQGVSLLVSDGDFIGVCRDKRNTPAFFKAHDIRMPEPRDKNHPVFPMFAKPYDGSLSQNLHIIRKQEDLTTEILNDPKLIFSEDVDIAEYKEFTVDMYYGKDHRLKSVVPRERLEIRAGEINKGITRKNCLVDYLRQRVDEVPGVIGCICMQLFYRERDNDVLGIEINPRFGGGYPLSYWAGANYPRMAIEEYLMGKTVAYADDWRDKTIMLRYDDEVIVYDDKA